MFPIQMTFTINNAAELAAINQAALMSQPGAATEKAKEITAAAPKPNAEAASKAADKVVVETEKKVEKLQGDTKPEGDAEKTYTIDDAKALTNKLVAASKRDEVVALLAEFDVKVAAKLPEDKIATFCKKAEALLA